MTSDDIWWLGATWIWWKMVKVWRAEEIGVPTPSQSPSNRRLQHTSAHMVATLWGFQQSAKDRVLITCYFDIFRRVSFLELYLQILHDLTALMFVALHPGDRAAALSIRGAPFAWTHYRTLFHNRFDHASIDIHATWAESTSMCVQIIPANWHVYIYIHSVTFFYHCRRLKTYHLSRVISSDRSCRASRSCAHSRRTVWLWSSEFKEKHQKHRENRNENN